MNIKDKLATIDTPDRIARLPKDDRGYPIPYFVAQRDPVDFRCITADLVVNAYEKKICWVCGEPLGRWLAFPTGPMCTITRTVPEPPSHYECALYSVRACPFLSNPAARRRMAGLPEEHGDAAGVMLKRNPGVVAIWVTKSYKPFRSDNGVLFKMGDPERVEWFKEGRMATEQERQDALRDGIERLTKFADEEMSGGDLDAMLKEIDKAPRKVA